MENEAHISTNGRPMRKDPNTGEYYLDSRNAAVGRNSNLSAEEYRFLETELIWAAEQPLISRQVMPVRGPLGLGVQQYSFDVVTHPGEAIISQNFEQHEDLTSKARTNVPIPIIQQNFFIERRDLEASRRYSTPLDSQEAIGALYAVNLKLEQFMLQGWVPDGTTAIINGLYLGAGNTEGTTNDFATAGKAVAEMGLAFAVMRTDKINPPFNLVLPALQYGQLEGSHWTTGVDELAKVRNMLAGGDVYQSGELTAGTGMLLSMPARGNFKMAMGVDITTEFWDIGNTGVEGCVFLTAAPAISDSNGICTLTGI